MNIRNKMKVQSRMVKSSIKRRSSTGSINRDCNTVALDTIECLGEEGGKNLSSIYTTERAGGKNQSKGDWKQSLEKVTYDHNDFICRQGEEGHCFFIITCGRVDVRIEVDDVGSDKNESHLLNKGGKLLHSLGPGDLFGERAIINDTAIRTTNCVANGKVEILKMSVTAKILSDNKELKQLLEKRKTQIVNTMDGIIDEGQSTIKSGA